MTSIQNFRIIGHLVSVDSPSKIKTVAAIGDYAILALLLAVLASSTTTESIQTNIGTDPQTIVLFVVLFVAIPTLIGIYKISQSNEKAGANNKKILSVLAGGIVTVVSFLGLLSSSGANVTFDDLTRIVTAISFIIATSSTVIVGLHYMSKHQKTSVTTVILKVFVYMFLIPLLLTAILVAMGWFLHWEGINPK